MSTDVAERPGRGYGRLLDLLQLLVKDSRGLTVSEISRTLDVPKSTVSLLVQHLHDRGFVTSDPQSRRFQFGPTLVQLAFQITTQQQRLTTVARPHLEWLSRETTEDVYLGIRTSFQAMYVDKVEGSQSVRLNIGIGVPRPMHSGAAGRVFLAFGEDGLLEQLHAAHGFPRFTERTLTDLELIRAELARVRERGYATSDGETIEGIGAHSAPVRDHTDRVIAALTVSGLRGRIRDNQEMLVARLLTAAHRLQMALGGPGGQ